MQASSHQFALIIRLITITQFNLERFFSNAWTEHDCAIPGTTTPSKLFFFLPKNSISSTLKVQNDHNFGYRRVLHAPAHNQNPLPLFRTDGSNLLLLISYSCIFIIVFLIPAFLSLNFPIPAFSYPCVLQSLLFFNPRFKQKPILRSSIFLSSMAQLLELRSILLWVLIRWLWNMNWV